MYENFINIPFIKGKMAENNLDQKKMSEILQIHVNSMGKKLRKETAFSLNEIIILANFFECNIQNFFIEKCVLLENTR